MKNQVHSVRQLFGCLGTAAILLLVITGIALAQTTSFTYQGKLIDNGSPASGNYDITFKLYDTATVGSGVQQGATLSLTSVAVSGGVFTVQLDFGACASCFNGAARFLEIAVKPTSGSTFTTLSPRQAVTANPYAIKSLSAATADGLSVTCVSCVTSSQIQNVNGSVVTGTIPVTSVPAGSTNYIQNTTTQQAASNFNISGDGTVAGTLSGNIVSAAAQYNLVGLRMLAVSGPFNGSSNFAASNTFLGESAGLNTTPDPLLFLAAGKLNSFFGAAAGQSNTTGNTNAFFGVRTGASNTTGYSNSFFGFDAGSRNTTGVSNTFIGQGADFDTSNQIGNYNTLLGFSTRVSSGAYYATAIGAYASVAQSDSLVLGAIAGVNNALHNTKVGIGTTAPAYRLHVEEPGNLGLRVGTSSLGGAVASFGPFGEFQIDAPNIPGGRFVVKETGKVGIGTTLPDQTLTVNGNASKLGGGSWAVFSDERLKTIRGRYTRGLNSLLQLQPIRYEYKPDNALGLRGTGEYIGFSAQEVERILPEAVSRSTSGYLQINNDPILWTMLNAVKEQQSQIEALQKENLELKARLSILEQLMHQQLNQQTINSNQKK
jgi:hypothetical protein